MSILTLGVDEAGRGPIVGPMVLAAVALQPRAAATLTRAGVADSKAFLGPDAHEVRSGLLPRILSVADYVALRVVDVHEIDDACAVQGLNRLERTVATELILRAPPVRRIVCDGVRLFRPLAQRFETLEAHDQGESVHVAVAAASIVAKVRRDELFTSIWRRYAMHIGADENPRGGGYLNDATRGWLRTLIGHLGALPPEGRHSWPWEFVYDVLPKHARPKRVQADLPLEQP